MVTFGGVNVIGPVKVVGKVVFSGDYCCAVAKSWGV